MKTFKIYIIFLFVAVFSGVFFTACINEDLGRGAHGNGEEIEVTFKYSVPGAETTVTRGVVMSEEQQKKINQVDILVYEVDGTDEKFVYHRKPISITDNAGTGTFKVRLARSKGNKKYTFDFLFNSSVNVVTALDSRIDIGDSREDVQQAIYRTGNFSAGATAYLQMWASFKDPVELEHDMDFSTPLRPIHTLVRLDIGLNLDSNDVPAGLDNFTLDYVIVHSTMDAGMFIPESGNFDYSTNRVTAPSVRHTATSASNNPISNNITDDCRIGGVFFNEPDYTKTASNYPFFIAIRGTYTDRETGEVFPQQYYRIDLMDPQNPTQMLQLLRNHKYRINITGVNGPGATGNSTTLGARNAYNAGPGNVRFELNVNQGGDINHIVYNNSNFLGVSDVHVECEGTVNSTAEIKVLTDVSSWRAVLTDAEGNSVNNSVASISPVSGTADNKQTVKVTFKNPNPSAPQLYYVTFTAGELSIVTTIIRNGVWYISSDYIPGNIMLGDGDQYEIYVWGNVPSELWVRAWSGREAIGDYPARDHTVSYDTLKVAQGIYTEASRVTNDLGIMGNAWPPVAIRDVEFQWSLDNGMTWNAFQSGPQGKGHYRLKTSGRIVSLYDIPTTSTNRMTWHEAMGVDYYWRNHFLFNGEQVPNYPYPLGNPHCYYYIPDASPMTGCPTYVEEGYEERYPQGKWRLPSTAEVQEMNEFYEHIGDLAEEGWYYWTSQEQGVSHAGAFAVMIHYGIPQHDFNGQYPDKENFTAPVRCVYGDPDPAKVGMHADVQQWYPGSGSVPFDPNL